MVRACEPARSRVGIGYSSAGIGLPGIHIARLLRVYGFRRAEARCTPVLLSGSAPGFFEERSAFPGDRHGFLRPATRTNADKSRVDRIFPDCEPRARGTPCLHHFVMSAGSPGDPLDKAEHYRFVVHLQLPISRIGDCWLTAPLGLVDTHRDAMSSLHSRASEFRKHRQTA